jgi:hypothetical protein
VTKPKKPSGETGPIVIGRADKGMATVDWQKIDYPTDKSALEHFIMIQFKKDC